MPTTNSPTLAPTAAPTAEPTSEPTDVAFSFKVLGISSNDIYQSIELQSIIVSSVQSLFSQTIHVDFLSASTAVSSVIRQREFHYYITSVGF
jgi:hypothetical protein